jgi:hypothetical protein
VIAVLAVAAFAAAAFLAFFGGPGGTSESRSQSVREERDCFGIQGIAGEAGSGSGTAIRSGSCGLVSAETLKNHIGSRADWYAAFSPKLSIAQMSFGCGISRADARIYSRKLGPTFSADTLREFRNVCTGEHRVLPRWMTPARHHGGRGRLADP